MRSVNVRLAGILIPILATLLFPPVAAWAISYSADYDSVKSQLSTPQEIAEYMTSYFTYNTSRTGFSPYYPENLNALRSGDCKDYSTFFSDILASHGYTVNQYAFRYDASTGYGHVVSIFTDTDGKMYVATNKGSQEVILGPVTTLDEAGAAIVAAGALPSGSVYDQWQKYPAGCTANLYPSGGFSYLTDFSQVTASLPYFNHTAQYLAAFFTVKKHPGAYAYAPETMNLERAGDAKDFAVISAAILKANYHHPTVWSVRYNQKTNASHVITVFYYGEKIYFQSLQYQFGPVDDFDGIVAQLKHNGHIPADSVADNWQIYADGYTGPFPVAATMNPIIPALLLGE